MNNFKEKAMKIVFLLTASFSILAVALICVFLFANGIPAIKEIGQNGNREITSTGSSR